MIVESGSVMLAQGGFLSGSPDLGRGGVFPILLTPV
jgi:hypothetical protein